MIFIIIIIIIFEYFGISNIDPILIRHTHKHTINWLNENFSLYHHCVFVFTMSVNQLIDWSIEDRRANKGDFSPLLICIIWRMFIFSFLLRQDANNDHHHQAIASASNQIQLFLMIIFFSSLVFNNNKKKNKNPDFFLTIQWYNVIVWK